MVVIIKSAVLINGQHFFFAVKRMVRKEGLVAEKEVVREEG